MLTEDDVIGIIKEKGKNREIVVKMFRNDKINIGIRKDGFWRSGIVIDKKSVPYLISVLRRVVIEHDQSEE